MALIFITRTLQLVFAGRSALRKTDLIIAVTSPWIFALNILRRLRIVRTPFVGIVFGPFPAPSGLAGRVAGLAAGDVYTVRLRETNAARVVGKGFCVLSHWLASDVPRADVFQPSGAWAFVGERRAHHHHGQHAPHGAP